MKRIIEETEKWEEIPLVSVVVITYCSADTLVETLDSIYQQDYKRLEMILSDDCSADDTFSVAEDWIAQHERRFERAIAIRPDHNTGTAANVNRGISCSKGAYIRIIAGDDLLTPNSISLCVSAAIQNKADWVVGRTVCFSAEPSGQEHADFLTDYLHQAMQSVKVLSVEKQFDRLLENNWLTTVGANFYSRAMFQRIGPYDERFPLLEDYPFWVQAYKNGYSPLFLEKTVAKYRINPSSISHSVSSTNRKLVSNEISHYRTILRPLLKERRLYHLLRARDIEMTRRNLLLRYGRQNVLYKGSALLKIFTFDQVIQRRMEHYRKIKGKEQTDELQYLHHKDD